MKVPYFYWTANFNIKSFCMKSCPCKRERDMLIWIVKNCCFALFLISTLMGIRTISKRSDIFLKNNLVCLHNSRLNQLILCSLTRLNNFIWVLGNNFFGKSGSNIEQRFGLFSFATSGKFGYFLFSNIQSHCLKTI